MPKFCETYIRHSKHFLNSARSAQNLYLQGETSDGLALFDTEWENIKAGQSWAANNFESNDDAAQLCNEYPEASAYFIHLRLTPLSNLMGYLVCLLVIVGSILNLTA